MRLIYLVLYLIYLVCSLDDAGETEATCNGDTAYLTWPTDILLYGGANEVPDEMVNMVMQQFHSLSYTLDLFLIHNDPMFV